ncbi:MAG: MOSC domain-containing protein [Anaeromyxobacteraceae bacterium]
MRVAELWRYPVKSMAGERLGAATLTEDGLDGDRVAWVEDPRGRLVTARTRPRLLGHRATLGPEGGILVDGRPLDDASVARDVALAADDGARLVRRGGERRFDVLPLLVATDGAIAAMGLDLRRFRPNVVVSGVEGLAEEGWPGKYLTVGDAVIAVARVRPRCVMTTYDPDTLAQDPTVLRRIVKERGGSFALDCAVVRGGAIRVGDEVALRDAAP